MGQLTGLKKLLKGLDFSCSSMEAKICFAECPACYMQYNKSFKMSYMVLYISLCSFM